jgi:integrase
MERTGAILPENRQRSQDVDLHSSVAVLLKAFIGDRKSGLLFCTRNGRPISPSNLLRRNLHGILKDLEQPKAGAHAFRRFRVTWLRKNRTPGDLERFWLGHANKTVTDEYSRLKEDVTFRKEVAKKVGIGFELPTPSPVVAPNAPKEVDSTSVVSAV